MAELLWPAGAGWRLPTVKARPRRRAAGLSLALLAALLIGVAVLASYGLAPRPAELPPGPLLGQALARGKLLVGVREYRRPALPGAAVLAEPDLLDAALANALGAHLGLPVELVGLSPAQQEAALAEGRVDLLIAGTSARPASASTVAVPPSARHDEGALLVLRGLPLDAAAPLRGRRVCVAEGSPYRRQLLARHGAEVRPYPSAVHAIAAFQAGECAALAEEASLAGWLLQQPEWRFHRRLPIALRAEDAGQVRLTAGDAQGRAWLGAALDDWRRRGAQDAALAHWIGETSVDVLKLDQGLICH